MNYKELKQKLIATQNDEFYDVVIHIGSPKTGSSALQKFLVNNDDNLIESGFYYPKHGLDQNGISAGHIEVSVPMLLGNLDKARKKFLEYISEAKEQKKTLLLSSESFYANAENLVYITNGFRCKIICFFRDPLDAVFSNYNQGVKRHSYINTVSQYISEVIQSDLSYYNGKIFEEWENLFGKENLFIFGYDPKVFKVIGIEEFFMTIIGISEDKISSLKPKSSKYINKSYTLAALELKRILNFVIEKDNMYILNRELDWFLQKVSDKNEKVPHISNMLDETLLSRLNHSFKESNQNMKDKYLYNLNAEFLTTNKKLEVEISRFEILTNILTLINSLKENKPELYHYIKKQTTEIIKSMQPGHDVLKLCEWLDIAVFDTSSICIWFNQQQINYISDNGSTKADLLRELAKLFVQKNDYPNAYQIIQEAIHLKPNAPGIIKLHKDISRQLGL
ncbi:MAG TPA: hypothetical protein ENK66_01215 [Arcobacter sp.]|nr:hypothetical protein [Arcobacter sp.]